MLYVPWLRMWVGVKNQVVHLCNLTLQVNAQIVQNIDISTRPEKAKEEKTICSSALRLATSIFPCLSNGSKSFRIIASLGCFSRMLLGSARRRLIVYYH